MVHIATLHPATWEAAYLSAVSEAPPLDREAVFLYWHKYPQTSDLQLVPVRENSSQVILFLADFHSEPCIAADT